MQYFLFAFMLSLAFHPFTEQGRAIDPPPANASLLGAWELAELGGIALAPGQRAVRIIAPHYTMTSYYNLDEKRFEYSAGGFYTYENDMFQEIFDFHTATPAIVGLEYAQQVTISEDGKTSTWRVANNNISNPELWRRLDDGQAPLAGAWRISERATQSGEMRPMQRGPRKTIKILSGSRFQWTAMNTETKEFFGAGGGRYTFENGRYTEHIEFFSRDSTRVGASLSFDGAVEGDKWLHSGLSSQGQPIKEIWRKERREME
jgi:hypothetical protein